MSGPRPGHAICGTGPTPPHSTIAAVTSRDGRDHRAGSAARPPAAQKGRTSARPTRRSGALCSVHPAGPDQATDMAESASPSVAAPAPGDTTRQHPGHPTSEQDQSPGPIPAQRRAPSARGGCAQRHITAGTASRTPSAAPGETARQQSPILPSGENQAPEPAPPHRSTPAPADAHQHPVARVATRTLSAPPGDTARQHAAHPSGGENQAAKPRATHRSAPSSTGNGDAQQHSTAGVVIPTTAITESPLHPCAAPRSSTASGNTARQQAPHTSASENQAQAPAATHRSAPSSTDNGDAQQRSTAGAGIPTTAITVSPPDPRAAPRPSTASSDTALQQAPNPPCGEDLTTAPAPMQGSTPSSTKNGDAQQHSAAGEAVPTTDITESPCGAQGAPVLATQPSARPGCTAAFLAAHPAGGQDREPFPAHGAGRSSAGSGVQLRPGGGASSCPGAAGPGRRLRGRNCAPRHVELCGRRPC